MIFLFFRDKTIEELRKLRDKHAGCLANIPPRVGTQRNESFHRKINQFFHERRIIGFELGHSLLKLIVYNHNLKKGINYFPSLPKISKVLHISDQALLEHRHILELDTHSQLSAMERNIHVESFKNLVNSIQSIKIDSCLYKPLEFITSCPFIGLPKSVSIREKPALLESLEHILLDLSFKLEDYSQLNLMTILRQHFSFDDNELPYVCQHSLPKNEWMAESAIIHLFQQHFKLRGMDLYPDEFGSEKYLLNFTESIETSFESPPLQSILLRGISNIAGTPIIVITANSKFMFQTLLPKGKISGSSPLFLAYLNVSGGGYLPIEAITKKGIEINHTATLFSCYCSFSKWRLKHYSIKFM